MSPGYSATKSLKGKILKNTPSVLWFKTNLGWSKLNVRSWCLNLSQLFFQNKTVATPFCLFTLNETLQLSEEETS